MDEMNFHEGVNDVGKTLSGRQMHTHVWARGKVCQKILKFLLQEHMHGLPT